MREKLGKDLFAMYTSTKNIYVIEQNAVLFKFRVIL